MAINTIRIVHASHTALIEDYFQDVASRLLHHSDYEALCQLHNTLHRQMSLMGKLLLFLEAERFGLRMNCHTVLTYSPYGKPRLGGAESSIHFNISHSNERVAVAISPDQSVGIDIEHKERDDLPEASSIFTPEEELWIDGDTKRYLTLWTRKEAVLKAEGKGLYQEPTTFNVLKNRATIHGRTFYLQALHMSDNYLCSIAFEKENTTLRLEQIEVNKVFFERILERLM